MKTRRPVPLFTPCTLCVYFPFYICDISGSPNDVAVGQIWIDQVMI